MNSNHKSLYVNCLYNILKKEKQKKDFLKQFPQKTTTTLIDKESCCENPEIFFQILSPKEILDTLKNGLNRDYAQQQQQTENQIFNLIQNAGLQKLQSL